MIKNKIQQDEKTTKRNTIIKNIKQEDDQKDHNDKK
jgi:hypothetical protein